MVVGDLYGMVGRAIGIPHLVAGEYGREGKYKKTVWRKDASDLDTGNCSYCSNREWNVRRRRH